MPRFKKLEKISGQFKAIHIIDTENNDDILFSWLLYCEDEYSTTIHHHIDDYLQLFNKLHIDKDEIKNIIKDMEVVIEDDKHKYDDCVEEYESGYDQGYDVGYEDGIGVLNNYIIMLKKLIN